MGATPQPTRTAAGKPYRNAGSPTRHIAMLPMATIAPAMFPPIGIFEKLICGLVMSSFKLRPTA